MLSRIQRSKSHRIPDPQHRPTQTYFAAFYYSVVLRSVPDPWHFGVDPDQDLRLCVIDIQDASNKIIFNTIFSAYYFWRYIYIIFQREKVKKSHKIEKKQGFSYYFCMITEGFGSGAGSGSIPLTSGPGSGSRRPKNMRICWIRIRNTGFTYKSIA